MRMRRWPARRNCFSGVSAGGAECARAACGREAADKTLEEIGEAISLGTERAAVLTGEKPLRERWLVRRVSLFTLHAYLPGNIVCALEQVGFLKGLRRGRCYR